MSISIFHAYFSHLTLRIGDAIADTTPNQTDIDPTLIENMRYAKEAIDYTLDVLPLGASNVPNAKVRGEQMTEMRIKHILKLADYKCKLMSWIFWENAKNYFWKTTPIDLNEMEQLLWAAHFELRAKNAEDFKMGNCGEQSSVALQYLKSQKKLSKLSSESMIFSDHTFLIIGKESEHFLEKSDDWKKSAVVCDPWARVAYPFSEYNYHIKKVCERNNLTLPDNNDFTSREHYFYQSKEIQAPIKPTLKPESDQLLQTQLKNYQSYKNRMLTHAYLEKKSQDASITLAAIGAFTSLGSIARKIKGRAGFVIGGSSFMASAGCYFARGFFPVHAKMYEEKTYEVWH